MIFSRSWSYLSFLFLLSNTCLARRKKVNIVILAGGTNAEGLASKEQLLSVIQNATMANMPSPYSDFYVNGEWAKRNDVFVSYEQIRHGEWLHGPLTLNGRSFGHNESTFGPEIGLGHVLGNVFDDPVVIVKAAWEKKSLGKDWRPPAASGMAGYEWYRMWNSLQYTIEHLSELLGEPKQRYRPQVKALIWFHGFDDLFRTDWRNEYEQNLELFVKDVREYLEEPLLPIVIGEIGGSGSHAASRELEMREVQRRVCQKHNTTTICVPTAHFVRRDKPWIDVNVHYYGRGDTMIDIGQVLGNGLIELMYRGNRKSMQERQGDAHWFDSITQFFLTIITLSLALLGYALYKKHREGTTIYHEIRMIPRRLWFVRLRRETVDDAIESPSADYA